MKTLPTEFKSKGFLHTVLKREGDVVFVARKRKDWKNPQFEVVRVRKYPTYQINGVTVEAHEAFPPDEAWGKEGWSYGERKVAENKFAEQVKENPYTTIMGEPTGGTRGRKRADFEIEVPANVDFTIHDLQAKYSGKSGPFIHLRLNELIAQGKVAKVGTKKSPSGRGVPMNVYRAL